MYARFLRVVTTAAIIACAAVLIDRLSMQPYRANILKTRVERQLTQQPAGEDTSFRLLRTARANASAIREALQFVPIDADLPLELAACYDVIGLRDDEIATYAKLLRVHRRPEVFQSLGMAEFEAGRYPSSIEHFSRAVAFDYLYIHQVPEALKAPVARRAEKVAEELAAELPR